jgi:hypothetical protein
MSNVINFLKRRLTFTASDKEYLANMCEAYGEAELPHILNYGVTDEGQEWCLVSKIQRRRQQNKWTQTTAIVAEIIVTERGYYHIGNWGEFYARSLQELFAKLTPAAYQPIADKVKGVS